MSGPKKSMSFDGMVKFFLQYYRIPTRKDFERLMDRIDQLEKLIKLKWTEAGKFRGMIPGKRAGSGSGPGGGKSMTASEMVVQVISEGGDEGLSFHAIKSKTGFDDKKLRNIIFRLNKLGRIRRKARGVYTV